MSKPTLASEARRLTVLGSETDTTDIYFAAFWIDHYLAIAELLECAERLTKLKSVHDVTCASRVADKCRTCAATKRIERLLVPK